MPPEIVIKCFLKTVYSNAKSTHASICSKNKNVEPPMLLQEKRGILVELYVEQDTGSNFLFFIKGAYFSELENGMFSSLSEVAQNFLMCLNFFVVEIGV